MPWVVENKTSGTCSIDEFVWFFLSLGFQSNWSGIVVTKKWGVWQFFQTFPIWVWQSFHIFHVLALGYPDFMSFKAAIPEWWDWASVTPKIVSDVVGLEPMDFPGTNFGPKLSSKDYGSLEKRRFLSLWMTRFIQTSSNVVSDQHYVFHSEKIHEKTLRTCVLLVWNKRHQIFTEQSNK